MRIAAPLMCCCLATFASLLHAQDSLLGDHKIDLRLKPLPAAEVINLLSVRSKSVGQLPDGAADRGRPWDVEGAEQLKDIVVRVNFVTTPVHQVVTETLGCIGFAYTEHGNRIVIEKARDVLPPDRCQSVTRMSASVSPEPAPDRRYSWHLQSISALEFITQFSAESGLNIVWPYPQTELLRNITLRVDVSGMRGDDVLKNVLGCIGWEFARTNDAVSAFKADTARDRGECQGFEIL